TRDYVYVKEVVAAYLALAEHAARADVKGEAFNFSAEKPPSALQIVAAVRTAVGTSLAPDVRNTATGALRNQHLDSSRAQQVVGRRVTWSIHRARAEPVAWYRDFLGRR